MTAFRGLRHRLALLRALATGSPYWQGRDSGLASARWAVIKGYPRGGVPPVIAGWDEYVERAGDVAAAAEAPDHSHVWWDLRARPRLGTLEVRVMDAQPSLDLAAGLAAPVQGLARHPVERPPASDLSSEVLAENDFRAAMYGLNTSIVDRDGTLRPAPALLRKQWRQHEPRLPLTAWPNRWMPSSGCSGPSRSTKRQRRIRGHIPVTATVASVMARPRIRHTDAGFPTPRPQLGLPVAMLESRASGPL